tara:strand:+ start:4085 stop:5239 length:1155 start_codon:yes stop_codon:yes gene_type:complete
VKLHEYQSKIILSKAGVPVPRGEVASSINDAGKIATELGGCVVVKAQIHAGGRGKAGGIKLVSSSEEAEKSASELIGTNLVTGQTSSSGAPIEKVLVEEQLNVGRELYLAILMDGETRGAILIASEAGGMEIEKVAEETPEKIFKVKIDGGVGLLNFQIRQIAYKLGFSSADIREFNSLVMGIFNVFVENDCSMVEINPLVVCKDGRILAADAKINFDDDAIFRHPELQSLHDVSQDDALESRAAKSGISYIKLDGDVGCMVNGAGLAMATMDVIGQTSEGPANFLDVGGGADEKKIAEAVSIILSDTNVKKVLINIFGGILRCDVVARGILLAEKEGVTIDRPIIVRMLGTNAKEGLEILSDSNLNVTLVDDLGEAAAAIATA